MIISFTALAVLLVIAVEDSHAQTKTPPYWASISANKARMRVGPSLDYPATWIYQRRDLPVRVVKVHSNWRKIEDPTGTQGWMHVRLLSDKATAMVMAKEGAMYQDRDEDSALLFIAQTGVVGMVSKCKNRWCEFEVNGKRGFIEASSLWGAVE